MGKEITGIGLSLVGLAGLQAIGYILAGWAFPAISGCIALMIVGGLLSSGSGNGGAERSGNDREDDGRMVVRGIDPEDPDAMIPGRS